MEKDKKSFVGDQNFSQLPVNADCAREWLKNKENLRNCVCLEIEAQKLVDLFANSLKEYQKKLKECKCEISSKTRTPYYDTSNHGLPIVKSVK